MTITLALAAFLALGAAQSQAKPQVGRTHLVGYPGHWKLLVPLKLDLHASGAEATGRIRIKLPGGTWNRRWSAVPHAGETKSGDRRARFTFRLGVGIRDGVARRILRNRARARVSTSFSYVTPGSGEKVTGPSLSQVGIWRAGPRVCETPARRVLGARKPVVRIPLPVCGRKLNWRIVDPAGRGSATIASDALEYKPAGRPGSDDLTLEGRIRGKAVVRETVHLRLVLKDPANTSVIAFGDSVTAGFGYFGATGKQMTIGQLYDCKPGDTTLNDACSSNSYNRNSSVGATPNYLPDYGLSRNISWAAQWANEYGITNYRNYAVTGSAPTDWLPNGQFHSTLETIQSRNPDYILMTLGANPLLSDVLFGVDNMKCALESDLFGDFRTCVLDAFESVDLDGNMKAIFTELVENTTSRIVVMEYPISVPSSAIAYSAKQLEMMGRLLNQVIGAEAAVVSTSRIVQIAPPRFNVGIDMEPLYPATYSCSFVGYKVDGPSVQSTPTQDELELAHPLSFCPGPAIGKPWVISGDTGIHPSTVGYSEMASQVPAPGS